MWLICQAVLGRGKNKLLVRGIRGAEWVFCPLVKSVKNGRIGTNRCQRCQHFVRFEQTYIPQAQITKKTSALKSPFHIRKSLSRLKVPPPHIPSFPHIPGLIRQREPLIDTFEEGNNITVLAELPGVEEKDVNITTDERTIMITAENATKKYLKIVSLPTRIKKDTTKFTYRNNILQIKLKKQD